jgi:hypothetical protein
VVAARTMKSFPQMTFGQRFALTVVICLVILFALALFGYLTDRWDDIPYGLASAESYPGHSRYDQRIAQLEREAIEQAFQEHVRKLYSVWMGDPSNPESARRAGVGARNGRKAYIDAMTAIDIRAPQH